MLLETTLPSMGLLCYANCLQILLDISICMCSCVDFRMVGFICDCHRNNMKIQLQPNTPSNSVAVCIFSLFIVTQGITQNMNIPTVLQALSCKLASWWYCFPASKRRYFPWLHVPALKQRRKQISIQNKCNGLESHILAYWFWEK